MHRFFVSSGQVADGRITIEGEDVNHIRNVLRLRAGEDFEAADEEGRVYTCRILETFGESIVAEVLFSEMSGAELPNRITLYMGLPKYDKMELVIQKAVELGAFRIVPVRTRRTVVKLDEKKAAAKVARWQSIAEAAAKQSKRALIPEVAQVRDFPKSVAEARAAGGRIVFPYECAEGIDRTRAVLGGIRPGEPVAVFIGPEGGFDPEEAALAEANGAQIVTLGRRILRTETAAITALGILSYVLER